MTLYESFMLFLTANLVANQSRWNDIDDPILWVFIGLAEIVSVVSFIQHLGAFLKGIL